jgi:beta-lysine 5,6-aminomutase beta subunit
LIDLARKQGMRGTLFLLGGPRIDHKLARELGFDAGFGPGTRPSQVASFIVSHLVNKR